MKTIAERLRDLARAIRDNVPQHRDPERFHERKSEIEQEALRLADEVRSHER